METIKERRNVIRAELTKQQFDWPAGTKCFVSPAQRDDEYWIIPGAQINQGFIVKASTIRLLESPYYATPSLHVNTDNSCRCPTCGGIIPACPKDKMIIQPS